MSRRRRRILGGKYKKEITEDHREREREFTI